MTITRIAEYRGHDIIPALLDLLDRANEGKLRGLAFAIKVGPHSHRLGLTGEYLRDPHGALICATRLTHRLNQMIDDDDGGPATSTMPL